MAVRNCSELGSHAQSIMKRLLANQNLVKLLYYTDKDPLSRPDLTQQQIQQEVFEKLIKITPRVGPKDTARGVVTIRIVRGRMNEKNNEFKDVWINIESFIPLEQWIIKDVQLRPFAVMGEIQASLDGKKINGLGKLEGGGNFDLNFLTDEISGYEQIFTLTDYD